MARHAKHRMRALRWHAVETFMLFKIHHPSLTRRGRLDPRGYRASPYGKGNQKGGPKGGLNAGPPKAGSPKAPPLPGGQKPVPLRIAFARAIDASP